MKILKDNFKSGGVVSQYPAEWFNTVARILNDIEGVNCRIEKTKSGWGWRVVVDPSSFLQGLSFPFQISYYAETSDAFQFKVKKGSWTRCGFKVEFSNDKLINIAKQNGTWYIYLQLDNQYDTQNDELVPDRLLLQASQTYPEYPEDSARNLCWVLGSVVIENLKVKSVTQLWWGGNIDDTIALPDSASNISYLKTGTLEWRTTEFHFGELMLYGFDRDTEYGTNYCVPVRMSDAIRWVAPDSQSFVSSHRSLIVENLNGTENLRLAIYGFDAGTTTTLGTNDTVMIRHFYDASHAEVGYVTSENFADWIEEYLTIHSSQIIWDDPLVVKHTNLDFSDGEPGKAGQNPDHDARYWIVGADRTHNTAYSCNIDSVIWSNNIPRIVLSDGQLYNSAQEPSLDWDEKKMYRVSWGGLVTTLDWGQLTLTGGEWSTDFNFHCWSQDEATGEGTGSLQVAGGASFSKQSWCGGNFIVAGSAWYQHGNNIGQSLSNWFSGGIFIGTNIQEKKIRVIDVDTDDTIEINVLVRSET
jgi:hypothetical protein